MPPVSAGSPVLPQGVNDWLELHEASTLLGISLSTMRRWADSGKVPAYRTAGGHRRFQRHELEALLGGDSGRVAASMSRPAPWSGSPEEMNRQEWHRKVHLHPAADRMRGLGQRLLGLLIQHVHSRGQDGRFLEEAGGVGTTYGKEAFNAGISLYETVKAFLFFRHACSQLTSPATGIIYPADLAEAARLRDHMDAFMDAVLLGVLAGYEGIPGPGNETADAGRQDQHQ